MDNDALQRAAQLASVGDWDSCYNETTAYLFGLTTPFISADDITAACRDAGSCG